MSDHRRHCGKVILVGDQGGLGVRRLDGDKGCVWVPPREVRAAGLRFDPGDRVEFCVNHRNGRDFGYEVDRVDG